MDITGKSILITGANRGLGRALALACARAGAREILAGARQPHTLDGLKADATGLRTQITPLKLDVTLEQDVQDIATQVGGIDVLINNAGIAVLGGAFKGNLADVQREIEVNYIGVLRMVRAFAPAMVKRGDGLIVNIASPLGKVNLPALGTYCATKAALLSLSQAMRGDLADSGVRVITVLPSTLDTDMTQGFGGPRLSTHLAAEEILEAIRHEILEAPIGGEARRLMAALATNPRAVEQAFARFRA